MRYTLYFFTMALLFVGGMLVGNNFLPQRDASLASAVSVPELHLDSALLQMLSREQAQQDFEQLNQFVGSLSEAEQQVRQQCIDRIKLRLALENFELKKTKLESEIAKNNKNNRTTNQLTQATTEYNQAREQVEKLVADLFPPEQPSDDIK